MDSEIKPLFASSYFTISPKCQFYQVICYDYADPDGYYERLLHDPKAFAKEAEMLCTNMQIFLDAEKVFINDERVEQKILHVDIGLRGAADIPYLKWVIFFQGEPKPGKNTLTSIVEEEVSEYDIEVLYLWPPETQIKEVQTPMEFEIRGSLLLVWSRKGDLVGGHEKVSFEFSS
jgi:hypothetical protein